MHALKLANAMLFLSTLSLRRATGRTAKQTVYFFYFYPRSPCGERLPSVLHSFRPLQISIHALLAESDERSQGKRGQIQISIHALLAESDKKLIDKRCQFNGFLSTLSLRRATTFVLIVGKQSRDFYPRSPCGERPTADKEARKRLISIHALLAESDCTTTITICIASKFLSTLSLRRATRLHEISAIHVTNFYPRSPCGERHGSPVRSGYNLNFYPRSPCGERRKSNKLAE